MSYHGYYLEIPLQFGNMILDQVRPCKSSDAFASIIVDIPDGRSRGEWWGIVVYIGSEHPGHSTIYLRWSFEASHSESGTSIYFSSWAKDNRFNGGLVTMIVTDNFIYIQQHCRERHNTSASKPFLKIVGCVLRWERNQTR